MKGCFDFTVDELGPRKVLSPIHLSTEEEDYQANYVRDGERIQYDIDRKEGEADLDCAKNLIQKAGPREYIYFQRLLLLNL